MKYVLLVFAFLLLAQLTSAKSAECSCKTSLCRTNEAIKAISEQLRRKASPKAVPAHLLAPVILRASLKYGIHYRLLTSVLLLESRGIASAYNKRTKDYGIMQINVKTARAMGLTMTCLMDYQCNVYAGARILSEINDGLICRYNMGTASVRYGKRLIMCQAYERKVALMQ